MNTKQLPDDSSSWKKKIVFIPAQPEMYLCLAPQWWVSPLCGTSPCRPHPVKWLMLFTVCALLPQVLISLWAGVWADRYNHKHLIMLADGFIALATLGLAVVFLLGV